MAWIDAQHLDIDDHVVLAAPGRPFTSEQDFLDWCARRSVIPLDHARPLWRMDVIPGLPGGRVGVLMVVHHVVADGLRGVATIAALLDPAPDDEPECASRWRAEPPPDELRSRGMNGEIARKGRQGADPGRAALACRARQRLA
jgi:diacylglycerol O-acyltransferase / wax synthase